ncbi:GNAT family N-acetyltransferase [Tumebacillus lipolyticus]|uniref:GNAT family N-acetyltransferase n=1 Tax=Tumebacillus lipolyticus TaxID=1280370 RepID=A0ABW4ZXU1_9BACL
MLHLVERNHEAYLPLLLLADPSEEMVRNYLPRGELYAWRSVEEETIGVLVLLQSEEGKVEIKNIAVREAYQGQGHGKQLLLTVLKNLKEREFREVIVSTGNSSIGNLAFYQKLGFRMIGIDFDYFLREYGEPIVENGIPCRDRILLSRPL